MHFTQMRLLSIFLCIASANGSANLLTFVDGSIGNVLGTAFGEPGTNATFDFVICGGGTAGLTMATRLASDPAISVAVIEAGGFYEIDNGNRSTVPGYANYYTGSDPNNYQPPSWIGASPPSRRLYVYRMHQQQNISTCIETS